MKHIGLFSLFALVFTGAVVLQGCSGSKGGSSTATTRTYAGSGSDWRFTLNEADLTFEATETESNTTIEGTYTETETGFRRLVVTGGTGAQVPANGTVISCGEIPGFALLCKPILSSEEQIIGTIITGTCPTEDWTNNFLNMQFNLDTVDLTATTGGFDQGNGNYDGDLFGTFRWDADESKGMPQTHYVLENYTQIYPTSPGMTGTCDQGIMTTTSFNAYLAPNAGFVKVTETGSPNIGNGIIIMPIETIGSVAAMDGDYAGLIFDATRAAGDQIHPIVGDLASGSLTVNSVSSTDLVTTDGVITGTATLTNVDSPSAGFIKGNVGGHELICMAGKSIGLTASKALFCLGQNPSNPAKPYMLLLGSK